MTALVTTTPQGLTTYRSPAELERRLQDLSAERGIIQNFLKEAMIPGEDYGVIPGTQLPTLYKAGAEKLNEMYGFFPRLLDKHETIDEESGHYRVVCLVGLFSRDTGVQVAECPGECSTRESKYLYRWVGDRDETLRAMSPEVRATLKTRMTKGERPWQQWRIENEDLHSIWNTILKMAFKRGYVGATHQATRSSGIFSQGEKELQAFVVEGEYHFIDEDDDDPLEGDVPPVEPQQAAPAPQQRQSTQRTATRSQAAPAAPARQQQAKTPPADEQNQAVAMNVFWVAAKQVEKDADKVIEASKKTFGKEPAELSPQQRTDLLALLATGELPADAPPAAEAAQGYDHDPVPMYNGRGEMRCEVCSVLLVGDENAPEHPPVA
jgi:hypothetical protein